MHSTTSVPGLNDSVLSFPVLSQDRSRSPETSRREAKRWTKRHSQADTARERELSGGITLPVLLAASNSRHLARLQVLLTRSGYQVLAAASGAEALRLLEHSAVSLALLQDVRDMTPVVLCDRLKSKIGQCQLEEIPVILLAERFDADEVVRCFQAGADDCVTGPHLESRVLLARIQSVMRACRDRVAVEMAPAEEQVSIGTIAIDPAKFRVYVDGQPLNLTRIQFYLLYMMARRPGWIFSHAQLRGTVARHGGNPDEKSIKSHISHLRRRLGTAARQIETVRGMGYRLCE